MEAHRRASDSRSKRGRSPERHAARHHNGGRPPHRCEPDYRDDRRARHGNTPWHADAGKHRSGGPRRADRRAGDAFSRPCRAGPTALVTLAQINESASAGLEPAKLSLLGPVVIAEWKRRNDDRNLPPKSSGMRVYPVSDTGWISELLRRPWDELGAMVQQSRAQAATTQRQAQLTANGTVVPVAAGAGAGAVAGAVAAGASAATGSSSAPPRRHLLATTAARAVFAAIGATSGNLRMASRRKARRSACACSAATGHALFAVFARGTM